jgi:hypothetical protein
LALLRAWWSFDAGTKQEKTESALLLHMRHKDSGHDEREEREHREAHADRFAGGEVALRAVGHRHTADDRYPYEDYEQHRCQYDGPLHRANDTKGAGTVRTETPHAAVRPRRQRHNPPPRLSTDAAG